MYWFNMLYIILLLYTFKIVLLYLYYLFRIQEVISLSFTTGHTETTVKKPTVESENLYNVNKCANFNCLICLQVQRQIALNRQNKIHQKTLSLLQGGSSILKKSLPGQKLKYVVILKHFFIIFIQHV